MVPSCGWTRLLSIPERKSTSKPVSLESSSKETPFSLRMAPMRAPMASASLANGAVMSPVRSSKKSTWNTDFLPLVSILELLVSERVRGFEGSRG